MESIEKLREWSRLGPMVCQDLLDIADEIEREITKLQESWAQEAREHADDSMRLAELAHENAELKREYADCMDAYSELIARQVKRIEELERLWHAFENEVAAQSVEIADRDKRIAELEDKLSESPAEQTCRNDKDKWSGLAKYLFVCSECGWNLADVGNDAIDISARLMKRCPNCGARVIGTEAGE